MVAQVTRKLTTSSASSLESQEKLQTLESEPARNDSIVAQVTMEPDVKLVPGKEVSREELRTLLTEYRETSELHPSLALDLGSSECSSKQTVLPELAELEHESEIVEKEPERQESLLPYVNRLVELSRSEHATPEELFDMYRELPAPRITYIPRDDRQRFLLNMSVTGKKMASRTLKYLSIIDDMQLAGLRIGPNQWTSAIHLAGRTLHDVTEREAEAALRMWRRMEEQGHVKSDNATFSVLFNIAARAGKFPLAEMILKEMYHRDLTLNRYGHVGIIYYHGLREQGDAIRTAYKRLVDCGEIVDTVVLNCVLTALLKAGELAAADELFARMKELDARQKGKEVRCLTRKERKELSRVLHVFGTTLKNRPEQRQELQEQQSLGPDQQTYVILIQHHVSHTGELARVSELLEDMQASELPPHGRIFLELFRGFSRHGGIRYSSWTAARLEAVWRSYWNLLEEGHEEVFVGKWIAVWSVRAFAICVSHERALKVWRDLKTRWNPSSSDEAFIMGDVFGQLGM